jgi:hypothetical protein
MLMATVCCHRNSLVAGSSGKINNATRKKQQGQQAVTTTNRDKDGW